MEKDNLSKNKKLVAISALIGLSSVEQGNRITLAYINRGLNSLGLERISKDELLDALKEAENSEELSNIVHSVASGDKKVADIVNGEDKDLEIVTPAIINSFSLKESQREFNKNLKEAAYSKQLYNRVLEKLSSLLKDPDAFNFPKATNSSVSSDDKALILNLSDIHLGEKDNVSAQGNKNVYDETIAGKRLRDYVEASVKEAKKHGVEHVVVVNVGDIINNVYMHPNQMNYVTMNVASQTASAVRMVTSLLLMLQSEFPRVSFGSIAGNHDRSEGTNKAANIAGDSVSHLIVDMIKLEKEHGMFPNVSLINNEDNDESEIDIEVCGQRLVFTHGEKIKRTAKDNGTKFQGQGKHVDFLVYAHYHSFSLVEINGTIEIGLPALKGFDQYPKTIGLEASTAGQVSFIIDSEKNLDMIPYFFFNKDGSTQKSTTIKI